MRGVSWCDVLGLQVGLNWRVRMVRGVNFYKVGKAKGSCCGETQWITVSDSWVLLLCISRGLVIRIQRPESHSRSGNVFLPVHLC